MKTNKVNTLDEGGMTGACMIPQRFHLPAEEEPEEKVFLPVGIAVCGSPAETSAADGSAVGSDSVSIGSASTGI